jgi:hypothetical protein
MNTENDIDRSSKKEIMLWILILGSLWGLSEAVLGNAMSGGMPLRASVFTGIGIGIMGIALGAFKRPTMLIGIALITAASKQVAVPLLGCSILCKANSCLAVLLHATFLAGTITLTGKRSGNAVPLFLAGFSAVLLSAATFYFAGMRLAPCDYLLSFNHTGGLLAFIKTEGIAWALFSGIALPAGFRFGESLKDCMSQFRSKPWIYYTASSAIIFCCWVVIILTTITELAR